MPTVTVRISDQVSRQGTNISATAVFPPGIHSIELLGLINDATKRNVDNSILLDIFASPDGLDWTLGPAGPARHLQRLIWVGGTHIDKITGQVVPNELQVEFGPLDAYSGWTFRGSLDIPKRMTVGLNATIVFGT